MKILIDTNVLFATVLYPDGVSMKAYTKAVISPNSAAVCDYSVDELRRVFNRKFPHKMDVLDAFFSHMIHSVEIISTPVMEVDDEMLIRDIKDRPILRAAIKFGADLLLSGDKDFLESGIKKPRMISPAGFLTFKK